MTDDHSFRPRPTSLSAALLLGAWIAQPATAAYVEAGRPGDPASWRSAEYQQDWGLERMRADQAYAAGIDGQGVKIGEMDSGFDPSHPDTPASRYQPVTASGTYVDGTPFSVSGAMNGNNDSHGTHVGGTLGASRDGVGMHGVAYAAQVYVANTNQNDSFLFGPTPDPNYFKAAYQALADAGVRAINNSWGSQPKDVSYETLDGLHAAYAQHYGRSTWLDAAAGVSRQGVINVFSAGNSGYANASVRSALPYFQPDLEGHWLAVSGLDQQNGQRYNRCGIAKYWCITTPGRLINSTMPGGGYANKSGTSMAAPHATGALALVMQRYPYLNNEQALQVLLTTATQLDGTPTGAPTDTVGWGVPDLGRAMHGPGQLLGRFEANLPAGLRDEWSNPISDSALLQRQAEDAAEHAAWQRTLKDKGWENGLPAGASQQERTDYAIGMARDQAAAQRQYQGSLVKAGAGSLVLSGDSTYRGPTLVDGGLLSVDGSLLSAVEVNAGGTLGGSGRIGGLLARSGGTVAAGNSIGTLEVAGDLRFESGSTYAVELSESASDRIVASGKASIAGGNVTLAMENSPDLLSQSQVESLVGRRYDILDAAGGIDGRFDAVLPNYLFLGGTLDYAANAIRLDIGRNGTALASVAQTPNQAAVAGAVEALGAGNPVYESLLLSENAATAQRAFQQLSGKSTRRSPACCSTTAAICVTASANACARPATARPAGGSRRLVQGARFLGQERRWQPRQRRLPAFGRRLPARRRQPGRQRHAPRPGGRLQQQLAEHGQQPAILRQHRQLPPRRLPRPAIAAMAPEPRRGARLAPRRGQARPAIRRRGRQAEGQARRTEQPVVRRGRLRAGLAQPGAGTLRRAGLRARRQR